MCAEAGVGSMIEINTTKCRWILIENSGKV